MGLQGGTLAPVRGNGKTVFTSDNWRVGVLGSLGWAGLGWLGGEWWSGQLALSQTDKFLALLLRK